MKRANNPTGISLLVTRSATTKRSYRENNLAHSIYLSRLATCAWSSSWLDRPGVFRVVSEITKRFFEAKNKKLSSPGIVFLLYQYKEFTGENIYG
jgi:hypothetical protein